MSPGGTVDLHKIPKLRFEGERSWKRGLGCYRQLKIITPMASPTVRYVSGAGLKRRNS
jgi:hypothetical protein